MGASVKKSQADGEIIIGDVVLPCAVLVDGTRVLSERGVAKSLGGKRGGAHWRRKKMLDGAQNLPVYISAPNLRPFISNELSELLSKPQKYKPAKGGANANGINAKVFPQICRVWADALKAGALLPQQIHIGQQALLLSEGMDEVAIVALVDEATGFQKIRADNELQQILSAYILPEHRPWMRRIPPEFQREIYRVYGWNYSPDNRGPRYAGKLIRKLIYEQMPQPVLPALENQNPANEKWQRKRKHFQHLTPETGLEHFKSLVSGVTALLRATPDNNRRIFWSLYERAYGKQLRLELNDEEDEGAA